MVVTAALCGRAHMLMADRHASHQAEPLPFGANIGQMQLCISHVVGLDCYLHLNRQQGRDRQQPSHAIFLPYNFGARLRESTSAGRLEACLRYSDTWYAVSGCALMPQKPLFATPETVLALLLRSSDGSEPELIINATGLVAPSGASDTSASFVPEPMGVHATGTSSSLQAWA
jgi:hypothetical protein